MKTETFHKRLLELCSEDERKCSGLENMKKNPQQSLESETQYFKWEMPWMGFFSSGTQQQNRMRTCGQRGNHPKGSSRRQQTCRALRRRASEGESGSEEGSHFIGFLYPDSRFLQWHSKPDQDEQQRQKKNRFIWSKETVGQSFSTRDWGQRESHA